MTETVLLKLVILHVASLAVSLARLLQISLSGCIFAMIEINLGKFITIEGKS